jgi:long-chain fatty acid transport protein
MRRICSWSAAFIALIACATADDVLAGGWDRNDLGIDLLFDPGKVTFDTRLYDLIPNRKFDTVNGRPESVSTLPNIFRPSVNLKFDPAVNAACFTSYRQPFGLDTAYPPTWSQAAIIVSRSLLVEELGLVCSYRWRAGEGYVRLIGGVTEDFATYHEDAFRHLPNGAAIVPALDLKSSGTGWRAGAAYEIPGKLRASLMYYADVPLSAHGFLTSLPLGGNIVLPVVPAVANASLPRIVEGVVQTAIAPRWIDTLSIKWADWSTITSIPVVAGADVAPIRAGRTLSTLNAFFLDGWSVANTITHLWSDALSLSLNLGWDRGVSTGWTDNPDTWSVLGFATWRVDAHLELTGGLGVFILAPGKIDKLALGGSFNATAGIGDIIFTHLGLRYRF